MGAVPRDDSPADPATAFRVYERVELQPDGYPLAWHQTIKHVVRDEAGHRCLRCKHPYRGGEHGNGEWSPCDERCDHDGPTRIESDDYPGSASSVRTWTEARWRILTVHHLDGDKANCRWWNLAPLCQRCHLTIQGRVKMDSPYHWQHSDWFKPYAAGFYAWKYLREDLTRTDVEERLDELLSLEGNTPPLFTTGGGA